jgi:hypothetical protein
VHGRLALRIDKNRILPELVTELRTLGSVWIVIKITAFLHRPKFGERIALDVFFGHGDHLSTQISDG